MLTAEFRPWHIPLFIAKYAWLASVRRPVLVHFEVTMRCNARCGFCDYWKTDPSAKASELKSFADAARYFNPALITFTGGEPIVVGLAGVALMLGGLGLAVRRRRVATASRR